PFVPTLCNEAPHIDEVWFPGVHADIGGGYRHRELAAFPLRYMLDRLSAHFTDHPVRFEPVAFKALTHVDEAGPVNIHYHGDGIKHDPRQVVVQKDDKPTRRNPKVHRSAFALMGKENVYLAEPQHSFARVQRVLYSPRGLGRFKEKSVAVD
ncbi:MAG: DUF2235 domain-containing protein, partial [Halieaceae bacterium]|nr:DUF2235 domain-containing protein [Halieaceae bacterium]